MHEIEPTVGRVVHYFPADSEVAELSVLESGGPLAAHIAKVWDSRCVNLMVIDGNGNPRARTSVRLMQPGDSVIEYGSYCEWMPYQVGQAQRTQEAESMLSEHQRQMDEVAHTNKGIEQARAENGEGDG